MLSLQLSSGHPDLVISVCAWCRCSQRIPRGQGERTSWPSRTYTGSGKPLSTLHLLEALRGAISCSKWRRNSRLRVKIIGFRC